VEAEQDRSVRIEELTEIGMGRSGLELAEERLVPLEAARHVAYADDRPEAFHGISSRRLERKWKGDADVLHHGVELLSDGHLVPPDRFPLTAFFTSAPILETTRSRLVQSSRELLTNGWAP
jgi:hypothetical protein